MKTDTDRRYRQLQSEVETARETLARIDNDPGYSLAYFAPEIRTNLAEDEKELDALIADCTAAGLRLDPVTLQWV